MTIDGDVDLNTTYDRFSTRVWNKKEKKMYYNFYSFKEMKNYKNNLIPMQCTGWKDKNGKLVYEGDVSKHEQRIKVDSLAMADQFCLIIRDETLGYGWTVVGNDIRFPESTYWTATHYLVFSERKDEIIGNIYENPELLK